jgi:hypothetical protein
MAATWRASVPQQPPTIDRFGNAARSAATPSASDRGSPSSSSSASSSSAWLRVDALQHRPATRSRQAPGYAAAGAMWSGCAQLTRK